ncbi:MAG TPA: mandelate racemase/muconate lactonizing enzyme family protein [Bryobacteraceae bacterium]|nr:mandelate racemase/muconate lactonizing enzyme family protein [Bryobacteraceae bacterium]
MPSLTRRAFLASAPLLAAALEKTTVKSLRTRKHTISNRDYLFVELETTNGLVGLGEGSMSGRVQIIEQAIQWFTPYLTGKDPGGIEDHWTRAYYQFSRYRDGSILMTALAAIDLALWDLEGKRLGLPVWRLCGSAEARPLRAYYSHWSHTLTPRSPERLAELAAKTSAEGWTCVKWVLPKGGTESERLRRLAAEVEAVRKGGGPDLDIGLEMWETFSARSALEFARAVAPFKPLFIEEPTWRELPHVLGEIAAQSPVPLAGGEGLTSRYEFRHLLDAKGAQIIQPDVIHCGGITEIRRIASLGEVYGVEISPHMYYGPVAHTASLHSMMSVRNFLMQEWDTGMEPIFTEITRGTFPRVTKGYVSLSDRPGLGIEMDWAECDKRFPYRAQSLRPPGGR